MVVRSRRAAAARSSVSRLPPSFSAPKTAAFFSKGTRDLQSDASNSPGDEKYGCSPRLCKRSVLAGAGAGLASAGASSPRADRGAVEPGVRRSAVEARHLAHRPDLGAEGVRVRTDLLQQGGRHL